ncbi:hypothetical protein LW893_06475 [Parvimonas micra]|nr:hypothetical protein [Parvimonas micra]
MTLFDENIDESKSLKIFTLSILEKEQVMKITL